MIRCPTRNRKCNQVGIYRSALSIGHRPKGNEISYLCFASPKNQCAKMKALKEREKK